MSGSGECRLKGLCIKASPLGENDRLITILTDEQGIVRLAAPGARRPKSSLAAATPITYLSLQIFGKRNLKSVRQIKILKSYSGLGKNIESLAAAQAITELTFLLVGNNDKLLLDYQLAPPGRHLLLIGRHPATSELAAPEPRVSD